MFKVFKAWRRLIRLTRDPKAWTLSEGVLKHGSHVVLVGGMQRVYVSVDDMILPLGPWRRWRLRRRVVRLLLKKLDSSL